MPTDHGPAEIDRRALIGLIGGGLGALALSAGAEAQAVSKSEAGLVRLSSVVTPQDGGLYGALLPDFSQQTGYRIDLATGEDAYRKARDGEADVVLSHYGHRDLQAFMADGLGEWPQPVFSNQFALLGPASDPAAIRGLTDLVDAFRRIAATKTPYVVNDTEGVKYLSEILWESVGRPPRGPWYIDSTQRGPEAVALAERMQGYTIWGLTPFLRDGGGTGRAGGGSGGGAGASGGGARTAPLTMQPLLLGDPLLQRIMVTVGVRGVPGVNPAAAKVWQNYLLAPRTQAIIRSFRLPGIDQQIWWPAGRNNAGEMLSQI